MSKENFYVNKIFKMVEDGMALVRPWGILDSADKDFLSFELAFFYFLYMIIRCSANWIAN